jgi:argininosuccinate lyase
MTLWSGRFSEPTDDDLRALNDSIDFDKRMYKQDIMGSIAYARALTKADVIIASEAEIIVAGLHKVLDEFNNGQFVLSGDEDIHTAVERRLTELVGDVGGKLHTGRSRNDQVATDFRLYVMDTIDVVDALLAELQTAFIAQSEQHTETLMPGYTHLQPAQPITVAHWLMSFFWMLTRDRERLSDAKQRMSVSPLGSGALSGTPFPIDRMALAQELGFDAISQNSLDAVSDRDFVAETLFSLALMSTHLSRFSEDIIIFSNPLFGFITLDDRYSTGSSLMPQKRNADPMELTRGKAGRLIGHLSGLLATLKGLPSSYNKDLQEDKEALFDAVDNVSKLLPVITAVVSTLHVNSDKMRAALGEELLATDLADYLVKKGMPFRSAHRVVGKVVQIASNDSIPISQISLETLCELSGLFAEDVANVFDFQAAVARRQASGGTAPDAVKEQIKMAKMLIDGHKQ